MIKKTKFKDLVLINNVSFKDKRGYFMELLKEKNLNRKFPFLVMSFSKKNVIRGLHLQTRNSQGKFISVIKGKIFDVVVDLRKKSKTYGKVFKKIINSKNLLAVYIPKGFVHGVVVLESNTTIINLCSSGYNPKKEFGINVKSINLNIPKMKMYFSKKDKNLIELKNYIKKSK